MENNIRIENVKRIYLGKAGKCACGCSGTYVYSDKYGSENTVTPAFRRRFNRFMKITSDIIQYNETTVAKIADGREIILYLFNPVQIITG